LSGKEFQEDGAATANARLARGLCVLGIKKFPRVVDRIEERPTPGTPVWCHSQC